MSSLPMILVCCTSRADDLTIDNNVNKSFVKLNLLKTSKKMHDATLNYEGGNNG